MIKTQDGRRPQPSRLRIAAVVAGTLALHALAVAWARSSASWALAAAGVASGLLVGAAGEWLVHRFLMHRRWRPAILAAIYDLHHRGHHFVHFTPQRYVHDGPINYIPVWPPQPDALCASAASRWISMGAQWLFYGTVAVPLVLAPTLLLAHNATFTGPFLATIGAELLLFVRLHDAVHYPGQSWVERLPAMGWLDRHHYLHHLDTEANTNFLLPLGDWLFGTLRTKATEWERAHFPSYAEARLARYVEQVVGAADAAIIARGSPMTRSSVTTRA